MSLKLYCVNTPPSVPPKKEGFFHSCNFLGLWFVFYKAGLGGGKFLKRDYSGMFNQCGPKGT